MSPSLARFQGRRQIPLRAEYTCISALNTFHFRENRQLLRPAVSHVRTESKKLFLTPRLRKGGFLLRSFVRAISKEKSADPSAISTDSTSSVPLENMISTESSVQPAQQEGAREQRGKGTGGCTGTKGREEGPEGGREGRTGEGWRNKIHLAKLNRV